MKSLHMIAMIAFAVGTQAGCSLVATGSSSRRLAGDNAAVGDNVPSSGGIAATTGADNPTVPDLIGKTPDEARALVEAAGFSHPPESTRPVSCKDAAEVEGKINCQDPEAGAHATRYSIIQVNVYQPQSSHLHGFILCPKLQTLHGLTVDDARLGLKNLGHVGQVSVRRVSYTPGCAENKVCRAGGVRGCDVTVNDEVVLDLNPKVTIAPPPP